MDGPEPNDRARLMEKLAGSLLLLSFGLAILAYLIAIDRPEWFDLRPASGVAVAMASASHTLRDEDSDSDDNKNARGARALVTDNDIGTRGVN